ncbi:DUF1661 domain-containing protein [Porphyromonas gingivalis]|uniref:DUF1661 domain-containing protein n=1 Tax=Porphyromonas gingivalis TaxID=837 RepID=UPI0037444959
MARQLKNLHAKTKKISRHFFRKHEPQSEDFWFVFPRCPHCRPLGKQEQGSKVEQAIM